MATGWIPILPNAESVQLRDAARSRIGLDSAIRRTDTHEFYERKGFEKPAFQFAMEL